MQFQFRADDDDRTSRVIYTFTEQILTETSLFTLKSSGQRLERAIVRTAQHAAAASVVEERIDSFLQHSFFVTNDDLRCA